MIRTTIQISIEELELLLDLLGPENTSDSENTKYLRRRLQEVMQYLRESNSAGNTA
jgi:hypothetical protein